MEWAADGNKDRRQRLGLSGCGAWSGRPFQIGGGGGSSVPLLDRLMQYCRSINQSMHTHSLLFAFAVPVVQVEENWSTLRLSQCISLGFLQGSGRNGRDEHGHGQRIDHNQRLPSPSSSLDTAINSLSAAPCSRGVTDGWWLMADGWWLVIKGHV
jgi:hypothetical protein